jgi:hypothetical protein
MRAPLRRALHRALAPRPCAAPLHLRCSSTRLLFTASAVRLAFDSPRAVGAMNTYITDFQSIMTHKVTYTKPGNGAFIHSCHTHCEAQNDESYTTFAVGGVTMQRAVSKWWAADGTAPASENSYASCEYKTTSPYKCNPTC